jgi:hypothetical protein
LSANIKLLPEVDYALAAFKEPTESGDGSSHKTHRSSKRRMVVPLSLIEEGSKFDSSRHDAAGGPVTSCKARE